MPTTFASESRTLRILRCLEDPQRGVSRLGDAEKARLENLASLILRNGLPSVIVFLDGKKERATVDVLLGGVAAALGVPALPRDVKSLAAQDLARWMLHQEIAVECAHWMARLVRAAEAGGQKP